MRKTFCDLAKLILENPDLKEKKNYEIYNLWFSKNRCPIDNIDDVKLILEYINDIKSLSPNLLADSLRKGP